LTNLRILFFQRTGVFSSSYNFDIAFNLESIPDVTSKKTMNLIEESHIIIYGNKFYLNPNYVEPVKAQINHYRYLRLNELNKRSQVSYHKSTLPPQVQQVTPHITKPPEPSTSKNGQDDVICPGCNSHVKAIEEYCPICGETQKGAENGPKHESKLYCPICFCEIDDGKNCPYCGWKNEQVILLSEEREERKCTVCYSVLEENGSCLTCGWKKDKKDIKTDLKRPKRKGAKQIDLVRAINYEKAMVLYKVKVTNTLPFPIARIILKPYITSDLFILNKESDRIDLLEVADSRTVTFLLRPKGECGNVTINCNVSYYDTKEQKNVDMNVDQIITSIVCPMLVRVKKTEEEWEETVGSLVSIQERTSDICFGKDELFDITSDVLKDMNMFSLPSKSSPHRNVGSFYGESQSGDPYAVKIEVIGDQETSKILIKTFAKNQESLVGCYFKILDEIESHTDIKKHIDNKTVIQHYHGDVVSGSKVSISDSVVQRSNMGME